MRIIILFLLSSLAVSGVCQQIKERDLTTQIEEVTVFLNSAQIFEAGNTQIGPGKTLLRIKGLSPYLDDKSIQVKGEGEFTILSVNHKVNYLDAIKRDTKIDSIHQIIDQLDEINARDKARLIVLSEKLSLLDANKSLGGSANGVSITQLKQALELFESEVQKTKDEEIQIGYAIEARNKIKTILERQLKELNDQTILPTSEIEIKVGSQAPVAAKFRVTYMVSNTGWFPKYDIRVENIREPLQIIYKAEVYQNTGVDWKDVKLRFSNGNPSQTGTAPTLNTWNLGFARYTNLNTSAIYGSRAAFDPNLRSVKGRVIDADGQSIPGVNVVVKGTTIGTVSDRSGNYSLSLPGNDIPVLVFSFIGYTTQEVPVYQPETNVALTPDVHALSESVVVGYGATTPIRIRGVSSVRGKYKAASIPLVTSTIENQTTVEIEVNEPYSIKSNGEKVLVDLKQIQADAVYEYYAVPKLDKDAFLIARLVNWDQHNLLEGEANLYFEEAFVGRSILNAKSLEDTLDISLGRDKNIVVGREKNEEYCKARTFGSNVSETRGFKIIVRNKKSQPVNITIFDQIPVSIISDISVTPEELSKARLELSTGKVTWQLQIEPQQQKELKLHYEVKYPKREKVFLE